MHQIQTRLFGCIYGWGSLLKLRLILLLLHDLRVLTVAKSLTHISSQVFFRLFMTACSTTRVPMHGLKPHGVSPTQLNFTCRNPVNWPSKVCLFIETASAWQWRAQTASVLQWRAQNCDDLHFKAHCALDAQCTIISYHRPLPIYAKHTRICRTRRILHCVFDLTIWPYKALFSLFCGLRVVLRCMHEVIDVYRPKYFNQLRSQIVDLCADVNAS